MNGLVEVILEEGRHNPDNGSLYVFRNKEKNKVKCLIWDRNGYVMAYKRLEKGRFDFPVSTQNIQVTRRELMSLLSGMPMVGYKGLKKPRFHY